MGQWRPSSYGNLGQRVKASQRASVVLPAHVMVTLEGSQYPGILLEWVRGEDGWMGRVVWAESGSDVQIRVLSSDFIAPIR